MVALQSDICDIQGGTTREGIHMGVMSGTLDLLQRYYAGSYVADGVLYFAPTLLDRLDGLVFSMQFHATPLRVSITSDELTVLVLPEDFRGPVRVGVGDDVRELEAGQRCVFSLSHPGKRRERIHHGERL